MSRKITGRSEAVVNKISEIYAAEVKNTSNTKIL